MYQIPGNSATLKLNDEEKALFNEVAENLQTHENTTFSNPKQVVFALISYCKLLETERNQFENQKIELETELKTLKTNSKPIETEVSETETELKPEVLETETNSDIKQNIISAIADSLELESYNPTDEELYNDIYEIITMPSEPTTITNEVIKEVERKLSENEFLISLKPLQTELLKTIARWRFISKEDNHTNDIPDLILRMLFNKGVLLNWHGQFKTGINESHLKPKA